MSEKAECPACGSYLSSIYQMLEYGEGDRCPSCDLPLEAMLTVLAARRRGADAQLTEQLAAAITRAEKAERLLRIARLVTLLPILGLHRAARRPA